MLLAVIKGNATGFLVSYNVSLLEHTFFPPFSSQIYEGVLYQFSPLVRLKPVKENRT